MSTLLFPSRHFLAWFLFAASLQGETWEATLSPFARGPFPEARPVRAQYAFGWSGLTAASADIHFTKSSEGILQFDATGGTIGVARALWRYDMNHTAQADAQTLRPLLVKEIEKTRAKETHTELTFAPEGVDSLREERKSSGTKTKKRRFDFPNVLSLDAAVLFLRSQPMPVGAAYRVVVYPATSSYLCTLTVSGRERITVPAGSYDAIKLDLQLNKIGPQHELLPHKKFRHATVWLSDDSDRLVLLIEAQVFIGKVFAELRSAQFENANP